MTASVAFRLLRFRFSSTLETCPVTNTARTRSEAQVSALTRAQTLINIFGGCGVSAEDPRPGPVIQAFDHDVVDRENRSARARRQLVRDVAKFGMPR